MLKIMINLLLKIISGRHKNDAMIKLLKLFLYIPCIYWAPSIIIYKLSYDIIDMF
jgi:hypothetical protein